MSKDAPAAKALLRRIEALFADVTEVARTETDEIVFPFRGQAVSISTTELTDGVVIVQLNAVVLWELRLEPEVWQTVAALNGDAAYGTITVMPDGDSWYAMLRYNFPGEIDGDAQLRAFIQLILTEVAKAREVLAPYAIG